MKKQRIIYVVGADMCGKTEITKELSRVTGIPYFKASSEHQTFLNSKSNFLDQLEHAEPRVYDLLRQTGHSVIFDRGWPCEAVYAPLFGRSTNAEMLDRLDEMYDELDATIVLCYRSSYEGIQDDLDPSLDSERLQEISDAYFDLSLQTKCKWAFINVDSEDLVNELAQLSEQTDLLGWKGWLYRIRSFFSKKVQGEKHLDFIL